MMKRRVADILWDEVARQSVQHVFMLSGGGIMHLADALGRSSLEYVCCHHEQSCSIAAQAYAMHNNRLGVCLVTTGPGGTNALTGCAAAYVDSTPVLFISGQVKTEDFASIRNVRQFGAQENDIVSMARPVSKYAVLATSPNDVLYHIQKAIYIATHGRRGPVWVDVPLDVQSAEVEESVLRRFDPALENFDDDISIQVNPAFSSLSVDIEKAVGMLSEARRPLILIGHGLIASGAHEDFAQLAESLQIPVASTWRGVGVMGTEHPLFVGSPGLQACRYANVITQAADFLLVIGSRIDNMITAFSEERFAFRAKKVVVDVDFREVAKLNMHGVTPVICDAAFFLERLKESLLEKPLGDASAWLGFCREMKERFPLLAEKQDYSSDETDLYRAADGISRACSPDDVIVASSTSRCNTAAHLAFRRIAGQRTISSMGFGSMGFALPSVIGAYFASKKRRIIMIEGDGSFQLNLQELQTICHYHMNAKLFVFSNAGYAAIAAMQDRNFAGFHVGCDNDSGVTMPALESIAAAYGIPFFRMRSNDEIDEIARRTLERSGPAICEIVGSMYFDEIPKCVSSVDLNGRRVSANLENPYPFLSQNELDEIYSRID